MKLSVRLARETIHGINELKNLLEKEDRYKGTSLTNGFVVNQAYDETKDTANWKKVIKTIRHPKDDKEILEVKTNLTLSQATIDGINDLKKIFPEYLDVSYVTTSFVIRIIIRGALILRDDKKANLK
ncbi:hypothetical protein KEB92_001471 [Listeria monocytogenes]|nr:hypothetical protein [Listeria monocytogenes]EAW7187109.1 hypothetical protein [Listeria monocytogenes]EHL5789014.1 hypothetical protein [Listeria monocytogenes]EHZ2230869.1 hypothetical protein [Listeria monocytogenes]EIA8551420.1 hypothetical protein [Listeria monocytogenes]